MHLIHIKARPSDFEVWLEQEAGPKKGKLILRVVPYKQRLTHIRRSREGCCLPFSSSDFRISEARQAVLHPVRTVSIRRGQRN
jgi:hypothetical protein